MLDKRMSRMRGAAFEHKTKDIFSLCICLFDFLGFVAKSQLLWDFSFFFCLNIIFYLFCSVCYSFAWHQTSIRQSVLDSILAQVFGIIIELYVQNLMHEHKSKRKRFSKEKSIDQSSKDFGFLVELFLLAMEQMIFIFTILFEQNHQWTFFPLHQTTFATVWSIVFLLLFLLNQMFETDRFN